MTRVSGVFLPLNVKSMKKIELMMEEKLYEPQEEEVVLWLDLER